MWKKNKVIFIQIGLLLVTICTTTIAGAEWMTGRFLFYGDWALSFDDLKNGLQFSFSFLLILTVHEFGHYWTALYHKVKVTLPFYIPLWLGFIPGVPSIGTMGAFITIKERINSKKKYFDIGVAGPLAGFVIALFVLAYAFTHLPSKISIYEIHPDYEQFGVDYPSKVYTYDYQLARHLDTYGYSRTQDSLEYLQSNASVEGWSYPEFQSWTTYEVYALGDNLLFSLFEYLFVSRKDAVPNQYEMMHYPLLFAGFLALLFTSINLLPIGQLDGGHILYGLVGNKYHSRITRITFLGLVYFAGLGIANPFALSNMMFDEVLYFCFLYICFHKFTPNIKERVMYALGVVAAQMGTVLLYPSADGYTGWLMFSFLLGRVLGIYHPTTKIDVPLDMKRKVVGWIALVVFILSFSPQPFKVVEINKKQESQVVNEF